MFVSGFGVKVIRDIAIIDKNVNVKKGYRCKWIIGCKLNGGVNAVKVRDESMKVVHRMCYHEDVVYVTPPFVWLVWSTWQSVCLKFGEEQIGIRSCRFPWLYRVSADTVCRWR